MQPENERTALYDHFLRGTFGLVSGGDIAESAVGCFPLLLERKVQGVTS